MEQESDRKKFSCKGKVHIIKQGDTLYRLAKMYDVKLFDIMRLNPYVNVYNLQIGDEICIPVSDTVHEKTYVVNAGDTMKDVLNFFQTSFDDLVRENKSLLEVKLPEGMVISKTLDKENHYMD